MKTQCHICQTPAITWKHDKMRTVFHFCPACEFISKDPSARISDEEENQIYNQHNNHVDDPVYIAYFQRFLSAAVLPHIGTGRRGFDFGSGPEPVLATLLEREYGYSMDIYDLFYAPEIPYTGKTYDLIVCTEVVEHLWDPTTVFHLFRQLLADGGTLGIMTLFHPEEASFMDWFYIRDPSHVSFYTPKTLQVIAQCTGLQLVYCDSHRYATFRK